MSENTTTAKARWGVLHQSRSQVLERARQASDITIPSILPAEGHTENSTLASPYQSLGARGVNNLASKMLLALFPATTAFFRLRMSDDIEAQLGEEKENIEEALRVLENRALLFMEQSNLRVMIHSAIKHMIVTGNGLIYMPKSGMNRMFRLNQYCVVRDPSGTWTELLIKETAHRETLPDNVREACQLSDAHIKDKNEQEHCDIYTWVKLKDGKHEWYQEINEIRVPGSDGRAVTTESPFVVLRWSAVENEDYGRGLVEEYIGDLRTLEGLNKAITQFAAAAAKIVILLHPNSATDEDDLIDAESGDVVQGTLEDIDVLQLEKQADFQVAKAVADEVSIRVAHAFLLQSGTTRDAERVTAEEIREQAQELEDVLGGVYTVQASDLQLPVVRRLLSILKELGEYPKFPEGSVKPSIVTGFEALGRNHELNRLRAFFSDVVSTFGEAALAEFRIQSGIKTYATSHNVDIKDMLKSAEEKQQEQLQAQQAQLIDKAAAPVAGAVAKGAMDQSSGG